jgi:hypothetical protein
LCFDVGLLLALREAAQFRQDALDAAAAGVVAGIEVARVHPTQLDQTAFFVLNIVRKLPDLLVKRR